MSTRYNPMVITAVLQLENQIERAALVELLQRELGDDARWSSRVVTRHTSHPRWGRVESMSWDEHVESHRLASEVNATSLEPLLQRLAQRPLPPQKPLWRAYLVTGATTSCALVVRVHHCVADGQSLLRRLGRLCEPVSTDRRRRGRADALDQGRPERPAQHVSPIPSRDASLLSPLRSFVAPVAGLFQRRRSPLRARLTGVKRLGASARLPLEPLLEGARRRETRLTALLLSVTACSLSRWVAELDEVPPRSVVALVPVDLRPRGAAGNGNRFASGVVRLPTSRQSDRAARLRAVHHALDQLRARPQANGWGRWIEAAGCLPRSLERLGVWWISKHVDVTVSSVKGPAYELSLLGSRVGDLVVWSPTAGRVGLSVTLTSYAGSVRVGVLSDQATVSDANKLARYIEAELAGCASS